MSLPWRVSVCAASCAACIAVGQGPALGIAPEGPKPPQPDIKTDSAALLKTIIEDMNADDVTLRIDAQQRLTNASNIKLRDIEQAVKGAALSPEQRRRVSSAAYVRFCMEPRAGMGIQSNLDFGERGLLLQAVVPGFPAAEVLRPGDRVLSVNGHAINDITMMRPVVISRDPGDEVPVVVVRAGATLNLKVRLGKATDLNSRDRFAITPDMLEEAWLFRVDALADPDHRDATPPIESGVPETAWQYVGTADVTMDFNDGGDPNVDPRFRIDARRLQNPDMRDMGIVAAGEPRGAGSQIRWATQGGVPTIRMGPGANVRVAPDANMNAIQADIERIRLLELTQIREAQARTRARIEQLRAELASANDARKREIVEQMGRMQRRIEELEARARTAQQVNP